MKRKPVKKLRLAKETVRRLTTSELRGTVAAGGVGTFVDSICGCESDSAAVDCPYSVCGCSNQDC